MLTAHKIRAEARPEGQDCACTAHQQPQWADIACSALGLQVGCTGGGSNFAGLANPFIREKLAGKMNPIIRAVEPAACPSLTRGRYQYDYGDAAGAHLAETLDF